MNSQNTEEPEELACSLHQFPYRHILWYKVQVVHFVAKRESKQTGQVSLQVKLRNVSLTEIVDCLLGVYFNVMLVGPFRG